jgi:hypothetical protein
MNLSNSPLVRSSTKGISWIYRGKLAFQRKTSHDVGDFSIPESSVSGKDSGSSFLLVPKQGTGGLLGHQ